MMIAIVGGRSQQRCRRWRRGRIIPIPQRMRGGRDVVRRGSPRGGTRGRECHGGYYCPPPAFLNYFFFLLLNNSREAERRARGGGELRAESGRVGEFSAVVGRLLTSLKKCCVTTHNMTTSSHKISSVPVAFGAISNNAGILTYRPHTVLTFYGSTSLSLDHLLLPSSIASAGLPPPPYYHGGGT